MRNRDERTVQNRSNCERVESERHGRGNETRQQRERIRSISEGSAAVLQDQIEPANFRGGFNVSGRAFHRDNHPAAFGRGDAPVNLIALLMRIAGKVHLCRQLPVAGRADFEVDV